MLSAPTRYPPFRFLVRLALPALAVAGALLAALPAQALPVFARQTGQNCLSCHAGGQFPELTPYGRIFKMTGYTIGARTLPLSVMGLVSDVKVSNTTPNPATGLDFQKEGTPVFATGSVFLAGKISDNLGAFVQITYDNYASQGDDGSWHGYTQADNMEFRYADHLIDEQRDLIYGVSFNNNPSVSDPWNTAAAWMQYVPVPSPSAYQFIDGATPYPGFGSGGNLAGISAYAFWNRTLYAELGTYRTANGPFSFMSFNINDASTTHLAGGHNPYWRLALSHEWGAHNVMVGTSGMVAHVYDGGSDVSDPQNLGSFRNTGLDAQYQYLLDPHTVTLQLAYGRQEQSLSGNALAAAPPLTVLPDGTPVANPAAGDVTHILRGKASYVYEATYGGSVSLFGSHGSTSYQSDPGVRGSTWELFWLPVQYARVGLQYTAYTTYAGAGSNYDGNGRNPGDNNSLFFYVWGAY